MNQDMTPDQIMEENERVLIGNLSSQLKSGLKEYIEKRRARLTREIGNISCHPGYSDAVVRAYAARLHEINFIEHGLEVRQAEGKQSASKLSKFWNKTKSSLRSLAGVESGS